MSQLYTKSENAVTRFSGVVSTSAARSAGNITFEWLRVTLSAQNIKINSTNKTLNAA